MNIIDSIAARIVCLIITIGGLVLIGFTIKDYFDGDVRPVMVKSNLHLSKAKLYTLDDDAWKFYNMLAWNGAVGLVAAYGGWKLLTIDRE